MTHPDASLDVTLNGARVTAQMLADRLRVPVGETVAWGRIFPRPEHAGDFFEQASALARSITR